MSHKEDKPPFLNTWNNVYAFVIGWLLITMLAFYLFTQYFS